MAISYALIENNIVENIIALNEDNAHEFPNAIKIGENSVAIGDSYIDGIFYDPEGKVKPTYQEELIELGKLSILDMLAAAYEEGANSI